MWSGLIQPGRQEHLLANVPLELLQRDAAQSRAALGLIDTRFHDHHGFNNELQQTNDRQQRLKVFGRLLSYLQDDLAASSGACFYQSLVALLIL